LVWIWIPFVWDFGPDSRLEENTREQTIIAHRRRLRAQGFSYRGIAARFDSEGILPKRGRRWIHTTVKSILMREAVEKGC